MASAEGKEESLPGTIPILDDSSTETTSITSTRNPYLSSSLTVSTNVPSSSENDPLAHLLSPTYESPAEFENSDFETLLRWYRRIWSFVLGIAGVLDILAYAEPTFRSSYHEICTMEPTMEAELVESVSTKILEGTPALLEVDTDPITELFLSVPPWYCSTWVTFLDRLKEYNVVIAFGFSLLWFMQSHGKAREAYYYKFSVREDRMQLFSSTERDGREEGNSGKHGKGWTKRKQKKYNATSAFYRRILSRMLLLPVGFYVIIFYLLRGLMNGEWLYRELLIKETNQTVFTTIQDPNEYVNIEISEAHAKMSTYFALFIYLKYHFLLATEVARAKFLNSAVPRLRRKLVVKLARNPRNFVRTLKKLLRYVRYIKYSIPLVIKLNKLRANIVASLRKRRQYRISKRQQRRQSRIRMSLEKMKSLDERKIDAAVLIQGIWRSHQKAKYHRVALCFLKDKRLSAALKIQTAYRRMTLQARIENSRKMRELFRLEQLKRLKSERMNDEERRRLYQLQDEFMAEAKKTINKRLLVRPNTRLSFLWNFIFVFCVFVEITQKALKPVLIIPKAKRSDGKKYRSMRLFIAESVIPTPVAETPVCKDVFKKQSALRRLFFHRHHDEQPTRQEVVSAFIDEISNPDYDLDGLGGFHNDTDHHYHTSKSEIKWRCREPILSWRDGFRDVVALTLRPDPVAEWSSCQQKEISLVGKMMSPFRKKRIQPLAWYCSKPYSVIHDGYRLLWNFVIDQIQIVISIICFFDVFVKFFTGIIDPVTGELKPKPFFQRWILPGLLLQLLVNPAIMTFSAGFFTITDWLMVIGPVRVLRWCIAVLVPTVYGLRNLLIHTLQETESDQQLARYKMTLWEHST